MEANSAYVIGWLVLHCGALMWAWATRLAAGSRIEWAMQLGFFAAMTLVGGTAWVCRSLDLTAWLISAVTLVAMVLTAVIDLSKLGEPARAIHRAGGR